MRCIKTGAVIWLKEYGEWAYGDAYKEGLIYVFRIVWQGFEPPFNQTRKHFSVPAVNHWFDQGKSTPALPSTLIAMAVTEHGENGWPIGL